VDTLKFLEQNPKLIPLKDAAKLIGVHYETLRLWAKQGRIAHIWCGRNIKFRPAALSEWLIDRETGGQH
jgi:excisionase family DNA binding protein